MNAGLAKPIPQVLVYSPALGMVQQIFAAVRAGIMLPMSDRWRSRSAMHGAWMR
jgi:hypothetical protein